jgi:hypothetical protein
MLVKILVLPVISTAFISNLLQLVTVVGAMEHIMAPVVLVQTALAEAEAEAGKTKSAAIVIIQPVAMVAVAL